MFYALILLLYSCQSSQNTAPSKDIVTTERLTEVIKQKEYSLIYFWTTWCGPCRKTLAETLPVIAQTIDSSNAQLITVAISKDEQKINAIMDRSALKSQKFRLAFSAPDMYLTHKLVLKNTLETLFPNSSVWNNSVPVFVLVDKNLNVLIPKIPSEIEEAITALKNVVPKNEKAGLLVQSESD